MEAHQSDIRAFISEQAFIIYQELLPRTKNLYDAFNLRSGWKQDKLNHIVNSKERTVDTATRLNEELIPERLRNEQFMTIEDDFPWRKIRMVIEYSPQKPRLINYE